MVRILAARSVNGEVGRVKYAIKPRKAGVWSGGIRYQAAQGEARSGEIRYLAA